MKKFRIIIISLVILIVVLVITDIFVVKILERKPLFAFNTVTYKDGGTQEYIGLGYKVIDYNVLQGRQDIVIGPFWIKYEQGSKENSKAFTISDETQMCAQALEEIARDNQYIYYLNCIKSQTMFLNYPDGTKISVRDALSQYKVTIYELIDNGLDVVKSPI